MRITGGEFRGRRLLSAPGSRPTQERVREALCSRWAHRLPESTVLELFCGGGALGLEALSRGARRVLFVDRQASALEALQRNTASLGLPPPEAWKLDEREALRRLAAAGETFDLLFADPPYDYDRYAVLLEGVAPVMTSSGELAVEHDRRVDLPESAGDLALVEVRRYGETRLTFYRPLRQSSPESSPGAGGGA